MPNNIRKLKLVFHKKHQMKKLLLSIFTIASLAVSASGLEVTASDIKLTNGNEWYMNGEDGKDINSFTISGSNVSWDFTSYESSPIKDTIKAEPPTLTGNGATVKISSNYIPETHYQVTSSDILMTSIYVNNTSYPFNSGASSGFTHEENSEWTSSITIPSFIGNIPATVSGSVLASGTITTSFGTFDALLVKETFSVSGAYTEDFYYWETKEYGRMALLIGNHFMVMTQNNFNVVVAKQETTVSSLNIFPNPTTDHLTVKANNLDNVKVYDAIGNLVANRNSNTGYIIIDTSVLKSGVYFVQSSVKSVISTSRVIVK